MTQTTKHNWRLAVAKRRDYILLYCTELGVAKTFTMPAPEYLNLPSMQALVKSYVDDYYKGKAKRYAPERLVDAHFQYIRKAYIICSYEVDVTI